MITKNSITLRGVVISINKTLHDTTIRLAIEGERGKKNFPEIHCYNPSMLNGINIQERVVVFAHAQERKIIRTVDGQKRGTSQLVVAADAIYKSKRALLDYFDPSLIAKTTGGAATDMNVVVVAGELVKLHVPDKPAFCLVRITVPEGDQTRQCSFSCFERQATLAKQLKEGDNVAVVGYVCTEEKTDKNGNKKSYMNMIARDIAVLEEPKQEA